jgi:hypothetical protein
MKSTLAAKAPWLVVLASLLVGAAATTTQAWPWRRAWVKQKMWQNLDNTTPNWIMVNGVTIGFECDAYKGPCLDKKFPEALQLQVEPPPPFNQGKLTGTAWRRCDTPRYTYRWIGIGCYGHTTASGVSTWWRDGAYVNIAPPFAGVAFNSPVSFVGMHVDSALAQPVVYDGVEYALGATEPDFDWEPPGDELAWQPTGILSAEVAPGDSVPVAGLPAEEVIGLQTLWLRGRIRGSYASGDMDPTHLTADHVADFVIAIYDTAAPVDVTPELRPGTGPLELGPLAPHPLTTVSTLRFRVAAAGHVRVDVCDLAGRAVRTLVDGPVGAGEHLATWDGRDARGRRVAAGLYLVRLHGGGQVASRKVLVLR